MARPLRIEFPGAVYHVTSRGDRREAIFLDDLDRTTFLAVVAKALARLDAQVLAHCLMDNHYHLVLYTRQANLSLLMRHINGVYTQEFNRRHAKVGHVFQGRFKAILVDRDAYLLELCRYVELNPVRAGVVTNPGHWPWSSYSAHTGQCIAPDWLDVLGLHRFVLGREATTAHDHREAATRYAEWVADAPDARLWDEGLRQQVFLGDAAFVERMQALVDRAVSDDSNIPKTQRVSIRTMADWIERSDSVGHALYCGRRDGGLTLTAMAAELGKSVSWASKAVSRFERDRLADQGKSIKIGRRASVSVRLDNIKT